MTENLGKALAQKSLLYFLYIVHKWPVISSDPVAQHEVNAQ